MAEKRRRTTQQRTGRLPTSIFVIAFIFVAGIGYVFGVFHTQIVGSILPLFGVKTYTGTLDVSSLQETYQALKANYDGSLNDQTLIEGANRGLVEAVGDEYTQYMNTDEAQSFNDDLTGVVGGGVGIELNTRDDELYVVRVLQGNPAEDANMKAGDVITAVNDEPTTDWTVDQAVAKIRGEIGTTVKLTVRRDTQTKEFTLTRAEINNPSVYSAVEGNVGILTITRFDGETGRLARDEAEAFIDKGVKAVILDLRGNGGGYLTAAQDVAGLWLKNKVVVTERNGGKVSDELYSSSDAILEGMRTIVLVDSFSASASEIVAGALQDHDAAELVGEKTYGKGSVQQLIDLPNGAELKVTVARWYTPNGKNISEQGIMPDVIVGYTEADVKAGRDPQRVKALQILN